MARLLVVDDNDTMREGMAVTLKKSGHDVQAFRTGADAVAAYKKSPFDVCVTDLKMEGMDGIEVIKALKAHDDKVSVMVVTAFGTIETAVQAMQSGAANFITKPFPPEELRAKVEGLLELSRARQQVVKLTARTEALERDAKALKGSALVGDSEPIQKLLVQVKKAAASEAT